MLDIEPIWFIVQLVNFLFLVIALNYILFRPLLRIFNERKQGIDSALNSARSMGKEQEELIKQIEARLAQTRQKANTVFESLSKDGLELQKKALESARKEGEEISGRAKEKLAAEAKRTKDSLRKDVENFSRQIVEKMVGV